MTRATPASARISAHAPSDDSWRSPSGLPLPLPLCRTRHGFTMRGTSSSYVVGAGLAAGFALVTVIAALAGGQQLATAMLAIAGVLMALVAITYVGRTLHAALAYGPRIDYAFEGTSDTGERCSGLLVVRGPDRHGDFHGVALTATPPGKGHGAELVRAALRDVPAGRRVVANAANRRLVTRFYEPLGFASEGFKFPGWRISLTAQAPPGTAAGPAQGLPGRSV